MRFYIFQIGHVEFSRWMPNDDRAVTLAKRWIRRFWARNVARVTVSHPGSIAALAASVTPACTISVHRDAGAPGVVGFGTDPVARWTIKS